MAQPFWKRKKDQEVNPPEMPRELWAPVQVPQRHQIQVQLLQQQVRRLQQQVQQPMDDVLRAASLINDWHLNPI